MAETPHRIVILRMKAQGSPKTVLIDFLKKAGLIASLSFLTTGFAAELNYSIATLAGAASQGSADGAGRDARFNQPAGLALDGAGNLFVADEGNLTIRKITPDGTVSTFAGVTGTGGEAIDGPRETARLIKPTGLTLDSSGYLYVADTNMVRKISPQGVVSTIAGKDGFYPKFPLFRSTAGIAINPSGTIYVAGLFGEIGYPGSGIATIDASGTISHYLNDDLENLAIDPFGTVFFTTSSNLAKQGIYTLSGGTATLATYLPAYIPYFTSGMKFGQDGILYVTDPFNHQVWKMTSDNSTSILAGISGKSGLLDGSIQDALFDYPMDVAISPTGTIFVSDESDVIRKITPDGQVSTIAGLYPASAGNLDGKGDAARLNHPAGIAMGQGGITYVADTNNSAIRKISPTGETTTLAKTKNPPLWVAVDLANNVYTTEQNGLIEKITPAGIISTFAGPFDGASGLVVDGSGNVFVADQTSNVIHKISPTGDAVSLALTPAPNDPIPGPKNGALLVSPLALALDASNNLYVLNRGERDIYNSDVYLSYVSKITPGGVISVFTGRPDGSEGTAPNFMRINPTAIAIDSTGNIYVTAIQSILRVATDGTQTPLKTLFAGTGRNEYLGLFSGIATDSSSNLYISDRDGNTVHKASPSGRLPAITAQPQSLTVAPGGSVQFSVTAAADPTPTYQWYFSGHAITGATLATYSFPSAQLTDAGDYSVEVSNSWGKTTSSKATLTVSSTPTPASPAAAGSGTSGSGGGRIDFWIPLSLLCLGISRKKRSQTGLAPGKFAP